MPSIHSFHLTEAHLKRIKKKLETDNLVCCFCPKPLEVGQPVVSIPNPENPGRKYCHAECYEGSNSK